jgi:hypothetical protein
MSSSSISIHLDTLVPSDAKIFVQNVIEIFEKTRHVSIQLCTVPVTTGEHGRILLTSSPGVESKGNLAVRSLVDLSSTIYTALEATGRQQEAFALEHSLNLYYLDKRDGGLGHTSDSSPWPPNVQAYGNFQLLLESWLTALTSTENARKLPSPLPTMLPKTRPMNLAEKILAHHAFAFPSEGGIKAGDLIRASVDWIVASELSWVVRLHLE